MRLVLLAIEVKTDTASDKNLKRIIIKYPTIGYRKILKNLLNPKSLLKKGMS